MSITPPPRTPTPSSSIRITTSPARSTSTSYKDGNGDDEEGYERQLRHFRTRSLVSPSPSKALFSGRGGHSSAYGSVSDLESLAEGEIESSNTLMVNGVGVGVGGGGEEMTVRINESCECCQDLLGTLHSLQEDLHLSASLGQSLLSQRTSLTKELHTLQNTNAHLLSSLSTSVSRYTSAEGQIQDLMATLETVKHKLGLMERDQVRKEAERKAWEREREDLKAEVEEQRREREKGERREKRWKERWEEERGRVVKGGIDRSESVKVTPISTSPPADLPNLLSLLSTLQTENSSLTSENQTLHSLLSTTRDEHGLLLEELERDRMAQLEERRRAEEQLLEEGIDVVDGARRSLMSEVLLAPTELASPGSPAETDKTTSFAGRHYSHPYPYPYPYGTWAPSASLPAPENVQQSLRSPTKSFFDDESVSVTGRSSNSGAGGGGGTRKVEKHTHYHYHSSSAKRRPVALPIVTGNLRRKSLKTTGSGEGGSESPIVSTFEGKRMTSSLSRDVSMERRIEELEDLKEQEELLKEVLSPVPREGEEELESVRKGRHRRELSAISMFKSKSYGSNEPSSPSSGHGQAPMPVPVAQPKNVGESGISLAFSRSAPDGSVQVDGGYEHRGRSTTVRDRGTQTEAFFERTDTTPSLSGPRRSPYASSISESTPSVSEGRDADTTMFSFNTGHGNGSGGSGNVESRTTLLNSLVDHAMKLLVRLKAADVGSLEKRLKKQNLTGDVRHLAHMTLKDLLMDIENIRPRYRKAIENEQRTLGKEGGSFSPDLSSESLVSRRDFGHLVRLLRDLLLETSRLRALVNKVELDGSINPSKFKDLDVPPTDVSDIIRPLLPEEIDRKAVPSSLLAPLSRFFSTGGSGAITPDRDDSKSPPPGTRKPQVGSGSNAVTAATVNVEFGSTGVVRRAVSVNPSRRGTEDVPNNTTTTTTTTTITTIPSTSESKSDSNSKEGLSRGKSLRRTAQDVQRLNSIFAGGILRPKAAPTDRWVVLPNADSIPKPEHSIAKAVIDGESNKSSNGPRLLEQTLRSRGLSDSSIHSTFLNHGMAEGTSGRQNSIATRLLTPVGKIDGIVENKVVPAPVIAGLSSSRQSIVDKLSAKVRAVSGSTVATTAMPSPSPSPSPSNGLALPVSEPSTSSSVPSPAASTSSALPIDIPNQPSGIHRQDLQQVPKSWFPSASFLGTSGKEGEWEGDRRVKGLGIEHPSHWRKVTGRWEG